jgi:O-antigen ligase
MGYILSIGVMLSYFFIGKIKTLKVKSIFLILILGILASLSRGPWVGFVIALFILLFLERKIMSYLVWGGIGIIALLVSPYSEKFISLLPGVGSDEGGTISYRQDLLVTSLEVIEENLWLGDGSFLANPKMQHLIQGEKIIDIVNTYLQVALEYGVVALGLYVLMLLLPIKKLYKLSKTYNHSSEERGLCNLFIAIMILTLVVIATVSSLGGGVITFIILVFISLISAYIKIITNSRMTTV